MDQAGMPLHRLSAIGWRRFRERLAAFLLSQGAGTGLPSHILAGALKRPQGLTRPHQSQVPEGEQSWRGVEDRLGA